ncbi:MAG TPA: methyltransferase domain-containing protein [Candidatus Limnocylindria bacterium]
MTTPAERFSETASGYAATMAPSLRPIAAEVVRRAALAPNERILDIGTGTGIAAAAARGAGRHVTGIDAAPGMLAIARTEVEGVTFEEMDFMRLRFADGAFDALIAAHSLLFAADSVAALAEWLRVTAPHGRLSLSVPGPTSATPTSLYAEIYDRHGIDTSDRYPTSHTLGAWARRAGWTDIETDADPSTAIILPDEAAFRTWRAIGSRGGATAEYTPAQHEALTEELLAATPRDARGRLCIPFGAIYLTARR